MGKFSRVLSLVFGVFVALLNVNIAYAAQEDLFITVWDTTLTGDSNSTSITIPAVGGPYNVDWDNDGIMDETGLSGPVTHDFGAEGIYTVNIENLPRIQFDNAGDVAKIVELSQWGTSAWTDMSGAFYGAANMIVTATDYPDLTGVTSLSYMFAGALEANPDTTNWITTNVIYFNNMFLGASSANPNTTAWDTSSAVSMVGMFNGATSANPDVSGWEVGGVTHFTGMFTDAVAATPDTLFWDTSSAVDFEAMFAGASLANPDTSNWDTTNVTNMYAMFYQAESADPDVSGWVTTNVLSMKSLFNGATSANPDVYSWDTSSVTDMTTLFAYTNANPDVSQWDTTNVTLMTGMFKYALLANPNISTWNISAVTDMTDMFLGADVSYDFYDDLLQAWSLQTPQSNVVFNAGSSTFCRGGYARETLVNDHSWTITDGGFNCPIAVPSFNLTAVSTAIAIGQSLDLTVTTRDVNNNTSTSYTGTAHFSTNPSTSVVPSDYTFVAEDNGVHTFSSGISFNNSGTYTLTVRDVSDYATFGQITVTVTAATIDYSTYGTSNVLPTDYKNYGVPYGITVLDNGDAWYVNQRDRQLVKISTTGQILRVVGRSGSGDGEFAESPTGITIDQFGYIYASDYCKISKFDQYGGFIKSWGGCGDANPSELSEARDIAYSSFHDQLLVADKNHHRIARYSRDGEYLGEFGGEGTDLGQLTTPYGLDVDVEGNIVVVEHNIPRSQIFNASFQSVAAVGSANSEDNDYFDAPQDVTILEDGRFVVTSQNSNVLKVFNMSGEYLDTWGGYGTGNGEFVSPQFITHDIDGNVWVTDWGVNRITMLDSTGNYVKSYQNNGSTGGKLDRPFSVATDSAGNVYVLDWLTDQGRVQMFTSEGAYVRTVVTPGQTGISFYHLAIDDQDNLYVSHDGGVRVFNQSGELIEEIGSGGTGEGQFVQARGMAFNSTYTRLYVLDYSNHRGQIFDISGETATYVGYFSAMDGASGFLMYPEYIYVDHDDNNTVYASGKASNDLGDGAENTVVIAKFDQDGTYIDHFNFWQDEPNGYHDISGLFLDSEGSIIVSDSAQNKIRIYDNAGAHRYTLGSTGGGLNQFDEIMGTIVHPTTGELISVDTKNERLHFLTEGVRIRNLIPSADVLKQDDGQSLVTNLLPLPGSNNIVSLMKFGDYPISSFSVDMSESRDWSLVNAIALPDQSKSLIVNLNPTDSAGVSETHSLYVTKKPGQTFVHICPNADQISDVTLNCAGGYNLTEADDNVTIETIDGVNYWVVSGLTGTGAMGQVVDSLQIEGSTTNATTGVPIDVTVIARGEDGEIMPDYGGTVLFEVSPTAGLLLTEYTFGVADAGQKTFNDLVVFYNAGTYTITVRDADNLEVVDTFEVVVTGAQTAQDNSRNNTSSSNSSASVCHGASPSSAPDLFQIDVTANSAKLFFTPINNTSDFYVSFSTSAHGEQHGEQVSLLREGVQSHTVFYLKPNTTYYFKVRGQIGCKTGQWSNIMTARTNGRGFAPTLSYYKNSLFNKVQKYLSPLTTMVKPKVEETPVAMAAPVTTVAPVQVVTAPKPVKKTCVLWWCW